MSNENEPPPGSNGHIPNALPGQPTERLTLGCESRARVLRHLMEGFAVEEVEYAPGSASSYHSPDGLDATELHALYRIVNAAVYSLSGSHVPTVAMMETYLERVCVEFAGQAVLGGHNKADCVNGILGYSRFFHATAAIGTVQADGNTLEVEEHLAMIPHVFGRSSGFVANTLQGLSHVAVSNNDHTFQPHPDLVDNLEAARISTLRDVARAYTLTVEILAVDYGVFLP